MNEVLTKLSDRDIEDIIKLFKRQKTLERVREIMKQSAIQIPKRWESEYRDVNYQIKQWWSSMSNKYNLRSKDGGRWSVDFNSKTIILN